MWPYIIMVRSAWVILCPLGLLYIERRFCHLNHQRIIHLCNVKEVAPSKRLITRAFIYLFYPFVSWFHNKQSMVYKIQWKYLLQLLCHILACQSFASIWLSSCPLVLQRITHRDSRRASIEHCYKSLMLCVHGLIQFVL